LVRGEGVLNNISKRELDRLSREDKEAAFHREAAVLLVSGNTSPAAFRSALSVASDYIHLKEGRLPVDASVVNDKSGRSILVFDPTNTLLEERIHPGLFSSLQSIWGSKGLYRTFQGVTHTNTNIPRIRGDFVEVNGDVQHVTQPLSRHTTADLYAAPPSALVYVVRDVSGVLPPIGRIQPSSAFSFFQSGFTGNTNAPFFRNRPLVEPAQGSIKTVFDNLLKEANPHVFVVNIGGKEGNLSIKNLDDILTSILDGTAGQAVVSPIKVLEIGAITKLPNLTQAQLNPYKGWKNKEEHQAAAVALSKQLGFKSN